MPTIDELLGSFATSTDQCWLIGQLEGSVDQRVSDLFARILSDRVAEDILRIEVLKSFAIRKEVGANYERMAGIICSLLKECNDDLLVRQYAAMYAFCFADIPEVLATLEFVVQNAAENEDVRWNALGSLQTLAYKLEPRVLGFLESLAFHSKFGDSVSKTLERIQPQ